VIDQNLLDLFPLTVFFEVSSDSGHDGQITDLFVFGKDLTAKILERPVGIVPLNQLTVTDVEIVFQKLEGEHIL
jgi:hypothetical protein